MGLFIIHNETEYLGWTLSDDILLLSIGTLNEECINCGAPSFLAEHGKIKHNVVTTVKLNSPVLIILRR